MNLRNAVLALSAVILTANSFAADNESAPSWWQEYSAEYFAKQRVDSMPYISCNMPSSFPEMAPDWMPDGDYPEIQALQEDARLSQLKASNIRGKGKLAAVVKNSGGASLSMPGAHAAGPASFKVVAGAPAQKQIAAAQK